jgi:CRP-like cAMP-binding protein
MASDKSTPTFRNRLLYMLPSADIALLTPHLRTVTLKLRQELEQPGRPIRRAYFIEQGIASVVAVGLGRDRVETGLIGPEGMTGLMILLGNHQSPNATFMQAAGTAMAIDADALRVALEKSESLRRILLKYAQVFLVQTAQTAVANARLTLEGRLARWLLMTQDRLGQSKVPMTHEFLSVMLGVRRAGVTEALHALEGKRAIRAMRGEIAILDRKIIEKRAGGLYGLPEAEYERLFGTPLPVTSEVPA